jgi:hypothetical protein
VLDPKRGDIECRIACAATALRPDARMLNNRLTGVVIGTSEGIAVRLNR